MYNSDMPSRAELPTTGQLIRSTVLALIAAVAILLTVVLPAEYAVDPTGIGRWLGLVEMGEIKQQLAQEAAADVTEPEPVVLNEVPKPAEPTAETVISESEKAVAFEPVETVDAAVPEATATVSEAPVAPVNLWRDEVTITLTPGQGTEIKLVMDEGAVARFSWQGMEGPLNYDTHGDAKGRSISYEKGRGIRSDEGELTAAFTGNHGWFFRNRTQDNVTLVLRMGGEYKEVKRLL
jgi:hypothetical protein